MKFIPLKFWSAFVGVLLLLSAPAKAADDLHIVDLTGEFDRFAMATEGMPDGQRIRAFEKQIGRIGNGFYSRERNPDGYDFRVLLQLKTYPQRRNATLTVAGGSTSCSRPLARVSNPYSDRSLPASPSSCSTAWASWTAALAI